MFRYDPGLQGKVGWGEKEKWLLFKQTGHRPSPNEKRGGTMKKVIAIVACVLIAPLAFAQTKSNSKKQAATTESVTVTGTILPTPEEGSATAYQPAKTLVVREDSSRHPGRYVLNGAGRVVDKAGRIVQTAIKPGTRVLIYYSGIGDLRMVDHVVVLD